MDLAPKRLLYLIVPVSLGILALVTSVHAGIGFGNQRSVGGVVIDGAGIVRTATIAERQELANVVRQNLEPLAGELDEAAEMRMISLKGLQQAIIQAGQSGQAIPDECRVIEVRFVVLVAAGESERAVRGEQDEQKQVRLENQLLEAVLSQI